MVIVCGYLHRIGVLSTMDIEYKAACSYVIIVYCQATAASLIACFIKAVIPNVLGYKMTDIIITVLILCLEVPVYHGVVSICVTPPIPLGQ